METNHFKTKIDKCYFCDSEVTVYFVSSGMVKFWGCWDCLDKLGLDSYTICNKCKGITVDAIFLPKDTETDKQKPYCFICATDMEFKDEQYLLKKLMTRLKSRKIEATANYNEDEFKKTIKEFNIEKQVKEIDNL